MPAVAAARQNARGQLGCDRTGAAKARGDLEIDKPLDPVRPARDVAAAHRGRECFGKTPYPDYTIEPVKHGETRRRCWLKIREDVVFDDRQIMRGRSVQHPIRGLGREGGPGRIVESRIRQVEARLVRDQRALERRGVRPRGGIGNPDDLDLMRSQQGLEIEVAGIVNQYGVAWAQEKATYQVDRLCPRVREDELV